MDKEDIKWLIDTLLYIVQIVLMVLLAKPKKQSQQKKPRSRKRHSKQKR